MSIRLLFLTFCEEQDFFIPVRQGMEDAARMMQAECVFSGVRGTDARGLKMRFAEALEGDYDGVAINLPCMEGFEPLLALAAERKIPIVGFNDDVRGEHDTRLAHTAQRLYEAGRNLGLRAKAHLDENAHVILSLHSKNAAALEQRCQGILDALADKNLSVTKVIGTTDPSECRDILLEHLRMNDSISAILGTGQADTEGAGLAARIWRRPVYVCGFDTSGTILSLLQSGDIDFTLGQQPYMQGFYPVVQLTLYLRKGLIPSDVDVGAIVITA